MKKLTLISVLAVLCLFYNKTEAQNIEVKPFQIGERLPDLPLKNIINYKDTTTTLSDFGNKIIILDFWATWCTSCIKMFPLEDSLQTVLSDAVQFILITDESKKDVLVFLEKYNRSNRSLTLPIIAEDSAFSRLFRFRAIPHYVWLAPNGSVLAESNSFFITKDNILNTLLPIREEEKRLEGNKYADVNLKMQKPSEELLERLSFNKN